jgi:hypothetical protein
MSKKKSFARRSNGDKGKQARGRRATEHVVVTTQPPRVVNSAEVVKGSGNYTILPERVVHGSEADVFGTIVSTGDL